MSLSSFHPVPLIVQRARAELSFAFKSGSIFVGRAAARLDVMGGIAEETGSETCSTPLDRLAAVTMAQPRDDGLLQIFSFDELDANRPFTLCMPIQALLGNSDESLRANLAEPGRQWAWSVIGALRSTGVIAKIAGGLNVALMSTVPAHAGLAASASAATASVIAILQVVGGSQADVPAQAQAAQTSMLADAGPLGEFHSTFNGVSNRLTRWRGDLNEPLDDFNIPAGMRFVAIDTNVQTEASDRRVRRVRAAAVIAHHLILKKMCEMGVAAGRTLIADPMGGFLSHLDNNDYKRWFRPYLPETLTGSDVIDELTSSVISIEPDVRYAVRGVADHHVLDALRVRNFARFIGQANVLAIDDPTRGVALDKAGHLMYASHQSLSGDATLGTPEADVLVKLIRRREREGLYGARLTALGCGGVVAVLCEDNERATAALADVLSAYADDTGLVPASYRTATQAGPVTGGCTINFDSSSL